MHADGCPPCRLTCKKAHSPSTSKETAVLRTRHALGLLATILTVRLLKSTSIAAGAPGSLPNMYRYDGMPAPAPAQHARRLQSPTRKPAVAAGEGVHVKASTRARVCVPLECNGT